jgi:hypothetical protein
MKGLEINLFNLSVDIDVLDPVFGKIVGSNY